MCDNTNTNIINCTRNNSCTNTCANTNETKPITSEDIAKIMGLPDTVSRKEYNNLMTEYKNLDIQLKTTESDRDCKAEMLLALEALIIEKGTNEMKTQMTIKVSEIFTKYNK